MKSKVTKLALSLVMGLSFTATAASDAKSADTKPADAKPIVEMKVETTVESKGEPKKVEKTADTTAKTQTQEELMQVLVDAVMKAAADISAEDLCNKLNKPEGKLADALKAVTEADFMLACYGAEGDDVKASTNADLVGKTPKTSDDKPARSIAEKAMKDAKDGKAYYTYTNDKKEERAVVAFMLGKALVTVGGKKK